jgi:hypothetical protein
MMATEAECRKCGWSFVSHGISFDREARDVERWRVEHMRTYHRTDNWGDA